MRKEKYILTISLATFSRVSFSAVHNYCKTLIEFKRYFARNTHFIARVRNLFRQISKLSEQFILSADAAISYYIDDNRYKNLSVEKYEIYVYRKKNSFIEIFKTLAKYRSKNNYVGHLN